MSSSGGNQSELLVFALQLAAGSSRSAWSVGRQDLLAEPARERKQVHAVDLALGPGCVVTGCYCGADGRLFFTRVSGCEVGFAHGVFRFTVFWLDIGPVPGRDWDQDSR
jgi:hypothetical protein